ncbi:hypothetical protein J1N35_044974 [Gossypium stocksii]|uniref:Uncharacterized protein n=1 Tax=Gossypium stocksii TaxID=47602 RepID=A0A9D3UAI5_9ROSI|nr:hypothetical protein J1N35_044974 [Gossypium stocksii]
MTFCTRFKVGRLQMRYIGAPFVSRKPSHFLHKKFSRSNCVALTNRIQGWSTKQLNYVGRLQLIKAIIFSVQAYWSHQFLMLKIILNKLICALLAGERSFWIAWIKEIVRAHLGERPINRVDPINASFCASWGIIG